MKNILIAVVGTSPAVLTETIWALATREEQIVPDEIVVLTTTTGRDKLRDQILSGAENSVWNKMKDALKKKKIPIENKLSFGSSSSIQVFSYGPNDLTDITTPEENTAAANFILKTIRAYSENPSTRILASIAGGRKTMSALMLSCMTLLGREDDKVLHVLINAPFDGAVTPPFFFPNGSTYKTRDGKSIRDTRAKIDLIELPYVKVRGLYEEKFKKRIPSYEELVLGVQAEAPRAKVYPMLAFDFDGGRLIADNHSVNISEQEMIVFALISTCEFNDFQKLSNYLVELHEKEPKKMDSWIYRFTEGQRFASNEYAGEDLSKVISALRSKLNKDDVLSPFADELLPKRRCVTFYPKSRMSVDIQKLLAQFK